MGILNVYIFAIVAMFPLLIIAILIKKNDLTLNNKKHKLLYHVCFLIITQLLLEILTYYFSLLDMRKWYFITYVAHDAYFLLDVLIFYKLALISIFDDKNSKVLHIIATIPFAIYVVLLFINHFTPIMFSIDKSTELSYTKFSEKALDKIFIDTPGFFNDAESGLKDIYIFNVKFL